MKTYMSLFSFCFFAFAMQAQFIFEDFEEAVEATDPSLGWIQESDLTPGYGWFYDTSMAFVIEGTRSAVSYGSNDDWLISPPLTLEETQEIGINFTYMTNPNSPMETAYLAVYIVNTSSTDIETDGFLIFSDDELNAPQPGTLSINYTAAIANDYYLAFHTVTGANASLSIDNVFVTDPGMNIQESNENSITIFPNPGNEILQVSGNDFLEINLYSSTGREVLKTRQRTLNIHELSPGFYIAKVSIKNEETVIKRILIK